MSHSAHFFSSSALAGVRVCNDNGFVSSCVDPGCNPLKFFAAPAMPSVPICSTAIGNDASVMPALQAHDGGPLPGLVAVGFSSKPPSSCPSSARVLDFQGSNNSILGESTSLQHLFALMLGLRIQLIQWLGKACPLGICLLVQIRGKSLNWQHGMLGH